MNSGESMNWPTWRKGQKLTADGFFQWEDMLFAPIRLSEMSPGLVSIDLKQAVVEKDSELLVSNLRGFTHDFQPVDLSCKELRKPINHSQESVELAIDFTYCPTEKGTERLTLIEVQNGSPKALPSNCLYLGKWTKQNGYWSLKNHPLCSRTSVLQKQESLQSLCEVIDSRLGQLFEIARLDSPVANSIRPFLQLLSYKWYSMPLPVLQKEFIAISWLVQDAKGSSIRPTVEELHRRQKILATGVVNWPREMSSFFEQLLNDSPDIKPGPRQYLEDKDYKLLRSGSDIEIQFAEGRLLQKFVCTSDEIRSISLGEGLTTFSAKNLKTAGQYELEFDNLTRSEALEKTKLYFNGHVDSDQIIFFGE